MDSGTFLSHDLRLLESVELKNRIKPIVEVIEEVKWEGIDPDMLTRFVHCTSFVILFLSYYPLEFLGLMCSALSGGAIPFTGGRCESLY